MSNEQFDMIMKRLDFIEFRQELLFSNSDLDRSIFEYGLTREQYRAIMDVMDEYRDLIENGKKLFKTLFRTCRKNVQNSTQFKTKHKKNSRR